MKNKQALALVLGGFLVLAACRKETACEQPRGIQGEWVWKKSVGGFGGWTLTPESEMRTQTLKIDDFFYEEYVNDSLVQRVEYDLDVRDENYFGTNQYLVLETGTEYAFKVSDSTLELYELCFDCFTHYYERK
ncbi:MAG: hypothetical protein HUU34_13165 [Saprospiraceae bacterium]|nr:hypothetical protein [Saprospiraceae bacterium]